MTPEELQQWQIRDRLASNLNAHGVPATPEESLAQLVGKVQWIGRGDPQLKVIGFFDYLVPGMACTNIGNATSTSRQNLLYTNAASNNDSFRLTENLLTARFGSSPTIVSDHVSNITYDPSRVRDVRLIGIKRVTRNLRLAQTNVASPTVWNLGEMVFTNLSPNLYSPAVDDYAILGQRWRMDYIFDTYPTANYTVYGNYTGSADSATANGGVRYDSGLVYFAIKTTTQWYWNIATGLTTPTDFPADVTFLGVAYGV